MKEIDLASRPPDVETGTVLSEEIETIYFGGGTPSLCSIGDLEDLMNKIYSCYKVSKNAEITLEANPDDINAESLRNWRKAGINRLSIGIQSFFDEDLRWMNRAHDASQSIGSLQLGVQYFNNITIDLIYGAPFLSNERWKSNVEMAIARGIPHLSCYALTVESKTPLYKMIHEHKSEDINPDKQAEQFLLLMEWLDNAAYEHYEISNFAKQGYRSRHNSSYWSGKKYLGIGPSAHSYNGVRRQWNISNNNIYIESIRKGKIPFEKEELTAVKKLNEYIMTSLRTIEGLNLDNMDDISGNQIKETAKKYITSGKIIEENNCFKLTKTGKLFADGIAADLFF